MSKNKIDIDAPAISREKRIMLRAQNYADGLISLEQFLSLERLDEDEEAKPNKAEPVKAPAQVKPQEKAAPVMPKAVEESAAKKASRKLKMSKDEYNNLSLYEQQQIYTQFPKEVEALVNDDTVQNLLR